MNKDKEIIEKYLKEYDVKRKIFCDVLNISKEKYIFEKDKKISDEKQKDIDEKLNKVKSGIPLEYVLKKAEFFGNNFYVDENVLIPRIDTEILIIESLKRIKEFLDINDNIFILDMCSGSGIIGITIAKEIYNHLKFKKITKKNIKIVFVDKSTEAIKIIKKNINSILEKNLEDNFSNIFEYEVIQSDLFTNLSNINKFDFIISNPPYIKEEDMKNLDIFVKKEPVIALYGGKTGTIFYEKILEESKRFLSENGKIIFEIGYDEKEELEKLSKKYYPKYICKCIKDFEDRDRVILIEK